MAWDPNAPQGNESGKIKWEIVHWTRGRGIDLGCGMYKTFPHFIGVDSCKDAALFGHPITPDVRVKTAGDLGLFASGSLDFVFSSHLLEHFPLEKPDPSKWADPRARAAFKLSQVEMNTAGEALREWMRVVKVDGYLILYVPDEDVYPKVGQPGANPDHCFNINYEVIVKLMKETGTAWDLVDFQKRSQDFEYSLFFVFQKKNSKQTFSHLNKVRPIKTCGLIRYGAYGDLLQTASVLRALKEQGYHVTLYTSPPGDDVIRHDPHIDAFYHQDKDQVPNHLLGEFWAYHAKKYDKWVNLSESVETTLLAVPNRTPYLWSPAARHKYMDHNYLEMMHTIAGVPFTKPYIKFYATETEKAWAKRERNKLGGAPMIMWALNGSSVHKAWAGLDRTIASILTEFKQSHVVLVGDTDGIILEQGWEKEPRVKCMSGKYSMRQTLALLEEVDVLIGPETGILNAACMMSMPKVVFLSHSTHNNLTRDWINTRSLASANTTCAGRGKNEAPACHMLHYNWSHCTQFKQEGHPMDGTAQCMADLDGTQVWEAIRQAIASTLIVDNGRLEVVQ